MNKEITFLTCNLEKKFKTFIAFTFLHQLIFLVAFSQNLNLCLLEPNPLKCHSFGQDSEMSFHLGH